MDEKERERRQLVADTGRELLERGLVARTWGNISVRADETRFAISPSGLGYEHMTADDVPIYDMEQDTWEGTRKPSSEKRIHAAAYRLHPETNFVIHTHQDYATAVGLTGTGVLEPTAEEKACLGNIAMAAYGLPGTKKLADNVAEALADATVVLMAHHGVLILGSDRDDAMHKAAVLEDVCKRAVVRKIGEEAAAGAASEQLPFRAQLDDMAQMIGLKYSASAVEKEMAGLSEDDREAMRLLVRKAILAKKYADACGVKGTLSVFDCVLMRVVYKMKYSRQKDK